MLCVGMYVQIHNVCACVCLCLHKYFNIGIHIWICIYTYAMYHNTGGVYTSDISATDDDGFYNTITYSLDNDYDGIFTINSMTGELRRTTNQSIPAPAAVSLQYMLHHQTS